ncbi:hypothetical protein QE250_17115, partial [Chromatiaceae bacterium AAb-1]|nr:hypothetical protein [Chromatiaceae bacterium AAb-1]
MVDRTYSFRTSIVVIVAITCGIIGIAVGFLMKLSPDYWPQLIGDIILYSFTAVLTSGVFAAILNSEQYSRVFQRHIFEVFNDPKKLTDIVD